MNDKKIQESAFDEYQKSVRHKYGFNSFILTMFLLLLNFVVVNRFKFLYATQAVQTMIIIFVAIVYFISLVTINGAYLSFRRNEIYARGISFSLFLMGIVYCYRVYNTLSYGSFFDNGMLNDNVADVLLGVLSMFNAVMIYYSYIKNK